MMAASANTAIRLVITPEADPQKAAPVQVKNVTM
jgi:hypothetical protein